ncbi:alpha/beta fold hydrolase [Viridibacillus sp. NPDC093762]|uniref:alpha/beta fold hydrolase n=1 Tax=Viridibacillus sp. NPDC093762 TaxID=3390720 RepID=UPI003D06CC87
MRKIIKVLKKLSVLFIIFMVLVTVTIFTYHKYLLKKESALIKDAGMLVDFNSKKIDVYIEGRGEDTYVFIPGSGVAAPVYEMKGLYSKFSTENKIAVINRAGYGQSDVFNDNRDIDTILEQTRSALIQSGNTPPYILVPHSLSGLEAIYWAQKYPNEVKGIIAVDIGLPQQYVTHKMSLVDSLTVRGMNLLSKVGFHRLFPSLTFNPEVLKQSFLTEHEKEVFKAISYKQFFNNNMEQELLQVYENGKKSVDLPIPSETPILFLDAIAEENKNSKYTKQKTKDYEEFAEKLLISDVITMEGKHSIYLYSPDKIYKLSKDFINNKVKEDKPI